MLESHLQQPPYLRHLQSMGQLTWVLLIFQMRKKAGVKFQFQIPLFRHTTETTWRHFMKTQEVWPLVFPLSINLILTHRQDSTSRWSGPM